MVLWQDVTERKASEAAFQLRDHALSNLSEVSYPHSCGLMPKRPLRTSLPLTAFTCFFHAALECARCFGMRGSCVPGMRGRCCGGGIGRGALPVQGITIADPNLPDTPIVYVNEAFCRITGYAREEVIGRNCRFLQGPDTDPAVVDRLRTALEQARGLSTQCHGDGLRTRVARTLHRQHQYMCPCELSGV